MSTSMMDPATTDSAELEEFEARIARGEKIEPGDWMPDAYRRSVEKLVGFHAVAEVLTCGPFFYGWAQRGPTLKRKLITNAMIQDEIGHGHAVLRCWETLGKTYHDLVEDFRNGRFKVLNIFLVEMSDWCEVATMGMFGDSLELDRLASLQHCSYGPYARALSQIVREEGFHFRQSCDAVAVIMRDGTDQQRRDVQAAVDKWWPCLMAAYGPNDLHIDETTDKRFLWKVKVKKNEELRQQYLKRTVRLFEDWGLKVPDKTLHFDEQTQRWEYDVDDPIQRRRREEATTLKEEEFVRYAAMAEAYVTRSNPLLPRSWAKQFDRPRFAS